MTEPLAYRDFYYPLNVFMHILTAEEGGVDYLHYGLFEKDEEPIAVAQERSTRMLLERLPALPARLLEVGIGLGTTLHRLTKMGYEAMGITPDEKQVAAARARYPETRVECAPFETFATDQRFEVILFQESSQYIQSNALFAKTAELTDRVLVLDEFALQPVERRDALHPLQGFIEAAALHGFRKTEEIDLSNEAAPTVGYFMRRIARYKEPLVRDLGLTREQVDELVTSGESYQDLYRRGVYGYRLLQF
ncbi:MAG TPA: methyltransferase domain-containing protein, partial [Thermoanaerobaculia bacterium]|nr:methyltransferase domain-containing protein [Thermoanaerobaculia bacterium]